MNPKDELAFTVFLSLAAQNNALRKALDEAVNGLWKAAQLIEPGYTVPPTHLYDLLTRHAKQGAQALEGTT